MKKLMIPVCIFLALATQSSCLKTYSCDCVNQTSPLSSYIETQSTTLKSPVKRDAENKCDDIKNGKHWDNCTLR